MKNLYLFVFMMMTLSLNSQSVLDTLDINDYKVIDYKYQGLSTFFTLNGNNSYNKNNYNSNQNNIIRKNDNGDLFFNAFYFQNINNRKKQIFRLLDIDNSFGYRYLNKNDTIDNSVYVSNETNYSGKKLSYLTPSFFIEKGLELDIQYKYDNEGKNDNTINIYNDFDLNINIPIGIGFGRIENISSAMQSYFILKDMNSNLLFKDNYVLNKSDIYKLADQITKRKTIRYYDHRLKIKDDIEQLTNDFFASKTKIDNPAFYTSFYDMWYFAKFYNRLAGKRFSFGILPGIAYNNLKYDYIDRTDNIYKLKFLFYAKFEYHKALNIKWQFDFETGISAGIETENYNDFEDWNTNTLLKHDLFIGFSYYPDTRSNFQSSVNFSTSLNNLSDENFDYGFKAFFNNSYSRYISPKFRLSALVGLNYYKNNSKFYIYENYIKHISLNYRFGVVYFIF